MSELQGQMNMMEGYFDPPATPTTPGEPEEGYDADGHLINPGMSAAECAATAEQLADEINGIKAQTRRVVFGAAMEIGARLIRAKALLPFGRWTAWLAERVDYSERTAQNLMRLYEEYGKRQIPQAIADLDYSKAVMLLGLPAEQREALAGDAAALTTRELQAEISRLRAENDAAQLRLDALLQQAEEAQALKDAAKAERERADRARGEADAARKSAEDARKEADKAKKQAARDLQRATDAVKRANDLQQSLTDAQARVTELENAEPRTVEVVPEAVTNELNALRRQAAAAPNEAVIRLRAGYERLLNEFRAVQALLEAVRREDAAEGEKYTAVLSRACGMMARGFEGGEGNG